MPGTVLNRDKQRSTDELRTPEYYLNQISPEILASLTVEQKRAIITIINQIIPKPSPKIVDLRFLVDLVFTRFYVVLMVGKDRRKKQRRYIPTGVAKVGNMITVVIFLLAANLLLSSSFILFLYLVKSSIGINIFSGNQHLLDIVKKFL